MNPIAFILCVIVVQGVVLLAAVALVKDGSKSPVKETVPVAFSGAVVGETALQPLPASPVSMAAGQPEPMSQGMPLEEPVANAVEELVILEADFMPLEMDDLAPEEIVLAAGEVWPVEDEAVPAAEPVREKGLAAVQLPLPLACEIRDPQLS